MPFDTKKQCRGCAFFLADEAGPKFKDDDGNPTGDAKRGECCRFPPADGPVMVSALYGCGEHKPG